MIVRKVRHAIALALTLPLWAVVVSCDWPSQDRQAQDRIIYYCDEGICEMDSEGGDRRVLVDCRAIGGCVQTPHSPLSPRRDQVLYSHVRDGTSNLGVVNVDGSQRMELVSELVGHIARVGWSFDGRYVAFSTYVARAIVQDRIYIVDTTEGTVREIIDSGTVFAWSPVENRIAAFGRYSRGEEYGLYVMNPDSGKEHKIRTGASIDFFDWSPDGRHLVLSLREDAKQRRSVFVIDVDSQDLTELTPDGRYEYRIADRPMWSPDRRHILYVADYTSEESSGVNALFVVNVETQEQRELVSDVESGRFVWSPDGQEITFIANKDHSLYKVSISDAKVTKLADEGFTVLGWE